MRTEMSKLDNQIKKLNTIARKIDELCESMHPSAWGEATLDLTIKYKKLATEIGNTQDKSVCISCERTFPTKEMHQIFDKHECAECYNPDGRGVRSRP